MKEIMKWFGAVLIACGVVGGVFVFGCGAASEDGSEDIGRTEEAVSGGLSVFGLQNGRTFGSTSLNTICTTSASAQTLCNWMHPYQVNVQGGTIPDRYSIVVDDADAWPSDHKSRVHGLITNTEIPLFNGELASHNRAWDQSGGGGGLHIGYSVKSPRPAVGDVVYAHYITTGWSSCQPTFRTETPAENGVFQSCGQLTFFIDTGVLQTNFPGAQFTAHLHELVAFAMDLAEGVGIQTAEPGAFTNGALSTTAPTAPFTTREKRQVETPFPDQGFLDHNIGFAN